MRETVPGPSASHARDLAKVSESPLRESSLSASPVAQPGGAYLFRGRLAGLGALAQGVERAADQPRDLHLGDPDEPADLGLRQVLAEAQLEDPPLPRRETVEQAGGVRARLCQ